MDLRVTLLQAANQIQIPLERKIGMQAAYDVKFGGAFGYAVGGAGPDFFLAEGVGAGGVFVAAESAEAAVGDADVCGIDVAIDVVIADVAVALFADVIG